MKNRRARERKYDQEMGVIARDWAKHITDKFIGQIQKKKISLTGELLESLEYSVNEGQGGNVSVTIRYAAHGKFLEMRNLYYNKMPPVDTLEAWVQKVGVDKFEYVPGYPRGFVPRPEHARRIAWGIASRIKGDGVVNQFGKWERSKQWRSPELRKGIRYLNHLLKEELGKIASGNIAHAFTQ